MKWVKKIIVYLIGLLIIAAGINISKLSALGISPVSSIPGVLNKMIENSSLGSMVIIVYCVLVIAQVIVLGKKFELKNILSIPVALIFGLMIDFLGIQTFKLNIAGFSIGIDHEFTGLMKILKIPSPQNIWMQIIYLLISIIVIGIGVYIYLKPKLVPMPAEGLAGAISTVSDRAFGNCKTGVDVGLIAIASVLQIIFLGGFESLLPGKGTVGIGTILSAVCVGQVVKFINKIINKPQKNH